MLIKLNVQVSRKYQQYLLHWGGGLLIFVLFCIALISYIGIYSSHNKNYSKAVLTLKRKKYTKFWDAIKFKNRNLFVSL